MQAIILHEANGEEGATRTDVDINYVFSKQKIDHYFLNFKS